VSAAHTTYAVLRRRVLESFWNELEIEQEEIVTMANASKVGGWIVAKVLV
jgi:hypothetical protein